MEYTRRLFFFPPPKGYEKLCENLRFAYIGLRMLFQDYDMEWARDAANLLEELNNDISTGYVPSKVVLYEFLDALKNCLERGRDFIPREIYDGLYCTVGLALEELKKL